jgi:deoxyadenosine/deoxycytidine kinase
MIITLEGHTGVGKSAIAKQLAKLYHAEVIRTSEDNFLYNLKFLLNSNPKKYELAQLIFYLAALQNASNKVSRLNKSKSVISIDTFIRYFACFWQ